MSAQDGVFFFYLRFSELIWNLPVSWSQPRPRDLSNFLRATAAVQTPRIPPESLAALKKGVTQTALKTRQAGHSDIHLSSHSLSGRLRHAGGLQILSKVSQNCLKKKLL